MLPTYKLESLTARYREIEELLCQPNVVSDAKRYTGLTKERAELQEVVEAYTRYSQVVEDLAGHKEALADPDLRELAASLDRTIGGAVGHSFGGKVVLEWLRSRAGESTEAWTIDSSISVAVMEIRCAELVRARMSCCTRGMRSMGSSTPRSPRATMAPSATSSISS